jgi:hypothetical protein
MPVQNQRPHFFEGQYIGAADLEAVVEHADVSQARHEIGAHTAGIAVGLNLIERPLGSGNRREVILQPGYAWDGFGRPLVVLAPFRLSEALFVGIPSNPAVDDPVTGKGRLVDVWLTYDEQRGGGPAPGFEDCDLQNQHARVRETFKVIVGPQAAVDLRAPVNIAGQLVDASDALKASDGSAPKLFDASVPFQLLPENEPPFPRWLIFVGMVRWIVPLAGKGYFIDRNADPAYKPDDLTRARRRYAGVVAEEVNAAAGAIVLRSRTDDPKQPGRFQERIAAQPAADVLKDLVWVEGNLRVEGDARLAAGRLMFRDKLGSDQATPLDLERAGDDPVSGLPGNRELRVTIGPDTQPNNRLVVGPRLATGSDVKPVLAVQSDGKVGVGTRTPTAAILEIKGDAAGTALFQASFDAATPPLPPAFTVTGAGDVGVGTNAPQAKLDVRKVKVTSGGSPLGQDRWLQVGNDTPGGDDGRMWVEYGPQAAPLLVLSDRDDPPRVQFQQIGTATEGTPQFASWIGHAGNNANDLAVMASAPAGDTRLGVNRAPTEALDIGGKVKFRPAAAPYDLLALGASQVLRVVIGKVEANGTKAAGDNFTSTRTAPGFYRIQFTPAFAFEPVILVTPINATERDNVMNVINPAPGQFQVMAMDVSGPMEGQGQDTAFSFVAFGVVT